MLEINLWTSNEYVFRYRKKRNHLSNSIHQFLYHNQLFSNQPIILSDFDGTISTQDVTDILLEHFGMNGYKELEDLWLAGKISSQECMEKQIALMKASLTQLNKVLDSITIDPSFIDLVHYAKQHNITIKIVSDGLDYAIEYILMNYGISHLPIYANNLLHDYKQSWRLAFPYANKECIKASGNCKCTLVKQQKKLCFPIIYVGDGASDFCVANKVDVIFAKNKLIDYCCQNNLAHYGINSFAEILDQFPRILEQTHNKKMPITMME